MIISVSGKIGSGKDTVGKIIQIITELPQLKDSAVEEWLSRDMHNPQWKVKKFADKLKDITCMLIGCTREQLEDREFKETFLGEEWTRYAYANGHNDHYQNGEWTKSMNTVWCSKERYEEEKRINWQTAYKSQLNPRLLLQLLGTECGRNIIHPNIWVNSLMGEYNCPNCNSVSGEVCFGHRNPNWIITDTRFPNELKAVKDKGGISIKVIRANINKLIDSGIDVTKIKEHESETALDNAEFDETIINDGSILDLIVKVREVLVKRSIINN